MLGFVRYSYDGKVCSDRVVAARWEVVVRRNYDCAMMSLAFYVAINVFRTEYRRPNLEGADAPQQVLQSAWRLTRTASSQ